MPKPNYTQDFGFKLGPEARPAHYMQEMCPLCAPASLHVSFL